MKSFVIDENRPIWQLTMGEFQEFFEFLYRQQQPVAQKEPKIEKKYVYGIPGIELLFKCSKTTANRIKASGKIDKAISQCGKKIVVDADLALELMKKAEESNN